MGAGKIISSAQLDMTLNLGWEFAIQVLPVMLPLVFLLSVMQTLVAAYAKNFREAQTMLAILQLIPMIPSMMLAIMPFKPQLWMYAVPLVGQQLTITRLLRGESVGALPLLVCFVVTLIAGWLLYLVARRAYNTERLAIST
jgi:sodium transport system permease protein